MTDSKKMNRSDSGGIPHEIVCCKDEELREKILPLLRGRVFHVTTKEGYEGIIRDGLVRHNKNGQLGYSECQSENSYCRKRGWVCLFDLRNVSDEIIDLTLQQYYTFLNPSKALDNPLYLIFSKTIYPQLKLWSEFHDEVLRAHETWIHDVECCYPGDIPADKIEKVIEVIIKTKPKENPSSLADTIINANWYKRDEMKRLKASGGNKDNTVRSD